MKSPLALPEARRLVLLGGGHTHALVVKMMAMDPIPGVEVTLVSDVSHAPYSGMLPGMIAGYYSYDETHIDVRSLAENAGFHFLLASGVGLDPKANLLYLKDRPPLSFDVLSINIGSTPRMDLVAGAEGRAIPSKPVPQLLEKWQKIIDQHQPGSRPRLVIVGGGAGGCELSLCFHRRLRGEADIALVHRGEEVLNTHNVKVRQLMTEEMRDRGVELHLGEEVVEVKDEVVLCKSGQTLPYDHLFWITQASGPQWLKESGLQLVDDRFIQIKASLQTLNFPHIFAAGDIATIEGNPTSKAGVFAVRMAKPLNRNLRHFLAGKSLKNYRPQKRFLSLIGTASGEAVASRGKWATKSGWMWWWKDWIDRKFMDQFVELPDDLEKMRKKEEKSRTVEKPRSPIDEVQELEKASHLRCGGCAAKVPSDVLSKALKKIQARYPVEEDPSIVLGLEGADDGAAFSVPSGHLLLQSTDHLTALVSDPFVFGQIAYHHGTSDIYAMGGKVHSILTTVLVPFAAPEVSEERVFQLMSGIVSAASAQGVHLLGGHTAENPTIALSIQANGLVEEGKVLTKGTMAVGNVVILTKPLGVGALFAAHMRGRAKGRWIDGAVKSMVMSNREAAQVFSRYGATASTDVTGFGVLGHLLEMIRNPSLRVELNISKLPPLLGTLEVMKKGIYSTLHRTNSQAEGSLANPSFYDGHPHYPLLFDPQTSGGLVATVPEDKVEECCRALQEQGCAPSVIGEVVGRGKGDKPVKLVE